MLRTRKTYTEEELIHKIVQIVSPTKGITLEEHGKLRKLSKIHINKQAPQRLSVHVAYAKSRIEMELKRSNITAKDMKAAIFNLLVV